MFRGREQHRPELGFRLLQRLAEDVTELGFVESSPKQDGRNMIMVLGPHKKKADAKVDMQAEKDAKAAEREAAEAEERRRARRRPRGRPGGAEEGARSLREPRPRDRGLIHHVGGRHRPAVVDNVPRPSSSSKGRDMPKNKTHSGASKRFR